MVYVHLADGFEEIEALTTVDLLRRAGIETETVSVTGRLPATGAHGVEVVADIRFGDAVYDQCEMIVLPGGLPGATHLYEHEGLREKLFAFANQGKWLAAICAAPAFVLGENGLLDGRRATCYPGCEGKMGGAEVIQDPTVPVVVDEGDGAGGPKAKLITSRGPATAAAFALAIIEALKGAETKEQIARDLLLE
ncbi:MAG: DJ-1/PfpI family protein [Clostridiales Family XIII bacterium]|jgi:4-methyl-5(b-hydroxyethyl)-thiazole monophosphate biosynthesis|nr:DJ-1/PfpI family protein [Clostridiales Family XIII bacterium]